VILHLLNSTAPVTIYTGGSETQSDDVGGGQRQASVGRSHGGGDPGLNSQTLETLNRKLCTLHPTPCILHPAPYTLHPTPCTLHPAHQIPRDCEYCCRV